MEATPIEILLVNDDGFEAEGIEILFESLTAAGHDVTLVAPKEQQSGTGTQINADRIFQPIEVENFAPNQWFVDGSPTVTTWAGLDFILGGDPPDLVISGINEGENVGLGAVSSGTVSAAVAALHRGIPAIAVSAGIDLTESDIGNPSTTEAYAIGAEFVNDLIVQLQTNQAEDEPLLPEGIGLSVNIPVRFPTGVEAIQGVALTRWDEVSPFEISFGELPPDFGEGAGLQFVPFNPPPGTIFDPESEGGQFLSGFITVTPIDGDWTASETARSSVADRIFSENILPGSDGRDAIEGTFAKDEITGEGGNDRLFGRLGDDSISGGAGRDLLVGNEGFDFLMGDTGNDSLFGGSQNDTLEGGEGNDLLAGGLGEDLITGGAGADRFLLRLDGGTDAITDFENGIDTLILTGGLSFSQLSITQTAAGTAIAIAAETIAILTGVDPGAIDETDFLSIG